MSFIIESDLAIFCSRHSITDPRRSISAAISISVALRVWVMTAISLGPRRAIKPGQDSRDTQSISLQHSHEHHPGTGPGRAYLPLCDRITIYPVSLHFLQAGPVLLSFI